MLPHLLFPNGYTTAKHEGKPVCHQYREVASGILTIMKRRLIFIAIICILLGSVAMTMCVIRSTHKNVIVYDGTSFTPAALTVNLGDTVTFENRSNKAFWPASNLHPSHLIWSDFDPKKPYAQGTSWSFTFTQQGSWGYHDHITPTLGGTVIVRDAEGNADDAFDCRIDSNKVRCWEKDIEALLAAGDINGTFSYIVEHESDPYFLQNCHAITHLVGRKAYHLFVSGDGFEITDATSYCGYGFFHGFMETLLATSGDIQEALNFCAYVNKSISDTAPDARDACYHGIGHGAVDGGNPQTWGDSFAVVQPALKLCEKVAVNANEENQCGAGVFDGLVTAYSEGSFGFSSIPENFYELCSKIDNPNFKEGCYRQMNPLASYFGNGDINATFDIIKSIEEPHYQSVALSTVIGTFARSNMTEDQYEPIINACYTVTGELRASCITGFARRLMEYGAPETGYQTGINFCTSIYLQQDERSLCFASLPISPLTQEATCKSMEPYTDISAIDQCN